MGASREEHARARSFGDDDDVSVGKGPAAAVLETLLERRALEAGEVEDAIGRILDGEWTAAQIAGFAIALRAKGETPTEIAAAARALRARAREVRAAVPSGAPVLDTCGTGGDGAQIFNVSTCAAIVVAAAGVTVAKHGNRAISSRAGSADLIEALGVPIEAEPGDDEGFDARVRRSIEEANIGFLYAPRHHAALRHAASVRRELGVRTVFNLLGPLANPGGATHQLLGVYDDARREVLARVLHLLGVRGAWVVHARLGDGRGIDEVSPAGVTHVSVLTEDGAVTEREIDPSDAGLPRVPLEAMAGGDATENARLCMLALANDPAAAPHRTAIVLNAACGLVIAGAARDLRDGRAKAEDALESGAARRTLERWRSIMRQERGR
jgi:anthranilate phosphoribosyltransferase